MQTTIQPEPMVKTEILGVDFDLDECANIATHGMAQGIGGFIYSTELAETFDEFENVIFDELDDYAEELGESSAMQLIVHSIQNGDDDHFYTMQDVKERAVWLYVEKIAYDFCIENNHKDFV